MMSRTLKIVGILALVFWTVGGLIAWGLVQDRVQIVFQDTETNERRSPEMALLHEDMVQIRKDLEALTSATRDGFQAVSEVNKPVATPEQVTTPAAKPATKRGFLAFKLPDRGFSFDKLQQFEIIPSLSRVGFDGKSTLHDFSGVTTDVRGRVIACLAHPDVDCSAWGEVHAKTLRTGHEGRDEEMFKHLSTKEHPKITFRIKEFSPTKVDNEALVVEGTATGQMTIRGVTRSHKMIVKLSVDDSRRLLIEGEGKITLTEYKIPIPTAVGFIRMHDEVRIWIAVRARCLGSVHQDTAKHVMKEAQHGSR